jgi:hypothetical protein
MEDRIRTVPLEDAASCKDESTDRIERARFLFREDNEEEGEEDEEEEKSLV